MWEVDTIKDKDHQQWLLMRHRLWPESELEELAQEIKAIAKQPDTQPVFVVRNSQQEVIGFLEASLRDYVDGCKSSPVPFIEGIYVKPNHRHQGVGKALVETMITWAKNQGFIEIASDTTFENTLSQTVHQHLGFEAIERIIIWRKSI
ncbi:GCN5-related N-acetyltransferase [Gloeothece citriformis PCC 7424]|uniref:Aminoglycoside N(6')-acetyltransferase type 1 n=1 Tax=Gloeothece citriformis (strain PCC 7424) TaxID=65393 RepID=B7KKL7_GLOC7|nr:aminoglycoside 6'-N-acetyltransferase [Gloeothece citriformis]ACK72350.1 GCN5-related N-acetyltransferase [Gloeothece citriformis PCC 7424]